MHKTLKPQRQNDLFSNISETKKPRIYPNEFYFLMIWPKTDSLSCFCCHVLLSYFMGYVGFINESCRWTHLSELIIFLLLLLLLWL